MEKAIQKQAEKTVAKKQPQTIKEFVNAYQGQIAKALPSVMTPERFSRMVLTAITKTPKLQSCSPQSFVGAMLTAAQLGLEPNTPLGQAYLIPYGNECQFQVGYRGLIDLANRSGEILTIEAHIAYENDDFDFEYGLDGKLKHKPTMGDPGAPQWVYALYKTKNGGYRFEVMSYQAALKHGQKYSKTYNNGPWKTEPEEMAKKTVLKKVLKYAPLKSDFARAVSEDDKTFTITEDNGVFVPVESEADYVIDSETGEILADNTEGIKNE